MAYVILLFKLVQAILLVVFAVFISDFRQKTQMVPFVHRAFIIVLKGIYLIPLSIYGWSLLSLVELAIYDAFALILTSFGTFLVVKGKVDLGTEHAWTGYRRDDTQIVTSGIYSYIRPPIYLGIFLFIAGGVCSSLPRISWALIGAGSLTLCYIPSFLTLSARRESHHLTVAWGNDYQRYKQQVHPFLPIRRFRKAG